MGPCFWSDQILAHTCTFQGLMCLAFPTSCVWQVIFSFHCTSKPAPIQCPFFVSLRQAGVGTSAWDAPVLDIRWQGQAGDLEPPCARSLQSLLSSAALGSVWQDSPRCCRQSHGWPAGCGWWARIPLAPCASNWFQGECPSPRHTHTPPASCLGSTTRPVVRCQR